LANSASLKFGREIVEMRSKPAYGEAVPVREISSGPPIYSGSSFWTSPLVRGGFSKGSDLIALTSPKEEGRYFSLRRELFNK